MGAVYHSLLKPVHCWMFFFLFHLLYLISHKALLTLPSHDIFRRYHAISIFCLSHCICLSVNWYLAFFNLFPPLLPEESINTKCLRNLLKIFTLFPLPLREGPVSGSYLVHSYVSLSTTPALFSVFLFLFCSS